MHKGQLPGAQGREEGVEGGPGGEDGRCREHLLDIGSHSTVWTPLGQATWLLGLFVPSTQPSVRLMLPIVFADTLNEFRRASLFLSLAV